MLPGCVTGWCSSTKGRSRRTKPEDFKLYSYSYSVLGIWLLTPPYWGICKTIWFKNYSNSDFWVDCWKFHVIINRDNLYTFTQTYKISRRNLAALSSSSEFSSPDTNTCIFTLLSWYFWELLWKVQIKANNNCRAQWQVPLSLYLVFEYRWGLLCRCIITVFLEEDGKLQTSHDRNPPG